MRNHATESIKERGLNEPPAVVNQQMIIKVAEMTLRNANMRFYRAAMQGDVKHLDDLDYQAEMAGLQMTAALNKAGKITTAHTADI